MSSLYNVRITPSSGSSIRSNNVYMQLLHSELKPTKFVISEEYSNKGKFHLHLVLSTDATKVDVNNWLTQIGIPSGNGGRSIQETLDEDQSITYTLKDGNFKYYGYTDEYIKTCQSKSFQKLDFNEEYNRLLENLKYVSQLTQTIKSIIQLHIKCGRLITDTAVVRRCKFHLAKHSDDYLRRWTEKLVSQVTGDTPLYVYLGEEHEEYQSIRSLDENLHLES